jgi:ribosomal protein S18 acetylase RimI-like enzyme
VTAPITLRPARAADIEAIATLWYRAWLDAHEPLVPAAALELRHFASFRVRVPERVAGTTVATAESLVVGFVTVRGDHVEQLYLAAPMRGSGVARALLTYAETVIAARFDRAWLTVASGNTRARHFYARQGWRDVGGVDFPLPAGDSVVIVPARRYEKWLMPP